MSDAANKTRVIIPLTGIASGQQQPRAVYDQMSSKIISALGKVETTRASNVEPGSNLNQIALKCLSSEYTAIDLQHDVVHIREEFASHWFADMTPSGHAVVLGPYLPDQRDQALKDEVAWLQKHNVPVCEACRMSTVRNVFQPVGLTIRPEVDNTSVARAYTELGLEPNSAIGSTPCRKSETGIPAIDIVFNDMLQSGKSCDIYGITGRQLRTTPIGDLDSGLTECLQPSRALYEADYASIETHYRRLKAGALALEPIENRQVTRLDELEISGDEYKRNVYCDPLDTRFTDAECHVLTIVFQPNSCDIKSQTLTRK